MKYTIKSTSDDGIYYLVNGWNKHKSYWVKPTKLKPDMLFNSPRRAKASLTKLLKVMEEYKTDKFDLVELDEDFEFEVVNVEPM